MKYSNCFIWLLIFGFTIFFSACQPDEDPPKPEPTKPKLTLNFNHLFDGNPLELFNYQQNAAGNFFTFSKIKYFVGDVQLMNLDGSWYRTQANGLIDVKENQLSFQIPNMPPQGFKGIYFVIGIDSITNRTVDPATRPNTDPLNPLVHGGMYWGWDPGFIFMKMEGKYAKSTGDTSNYLYHIGRDKFASYVELQTDTFYLESAQNTNLFFDVHLDKFFNSPNEFDIENDGDLSHSSLSDLTILPKLHPNIKGMFQYKDMAIVVE